MDGTRAAATRSRRIGYATLALSLVAAFIADTYDLWNMVWTVPLVLAFYLFGRGDGLAAARYVRRIR